MHVLWMSPEGEMEHYCPPEKLRSPMRAFLGFEGSWVQGDKGRRAKPISAGAFVANTWMLAFGATAWWIAGMWRRK